MTTISQKQSSLAVAALALIAGVALSVPNSVSAANLATYDFEFKFTDTTTGNGFITVDKDDVSHFDNNSGYDYSLWVQHKWVDFSFGYLGTTYTKADAMPNSYFARYDIPNGSVFYPDYGNSFSIISASRSDGKSLHGQASATGYNPNGYVDGNYATSFTITPRAVPVPGFAFGIVAAGGWLASKQLRRKTQTAKQSVSA